MSSLIRRCLAALLPASWVLLAWVSSAQSQTPLRVDSREERVRIDGFLRDWTDRSFTTLGSGDDARMRYALLADDEALFLAFEVSDERVSPGKRTGRGGDQLRIWLAMPRGKGWRGTELRISPGQPGKRPSRAWLGPVGGKLVSRRDVQVVDGPRAQGAGFVLEARVPWQRIPGGRLWGQGRGAIAYLDVDGAAGARVERRLATAAMSTGDLSALPRLIAAGGVQGLLREFLVAKGLPGLEPNFDLRGNVAGDGRDERVAIVDRYVVVSGPGYRGGAAYGFMELPTTPGGSLLGAGLRDLTGDGRAELLITLRQRNRLGSRDLWQVLTLDGDQPQVAFALELRKQTRDGFVENALELQTGRSGAATRIRVRPGDSRGLDATNFREASAPDARGLLLPWGPLLERDYAFQGGRFMVVAERARPAPVARSAPRAAAARPARGARAARAARPAATLVRLPANPQPSDLVRAFKQRAGIRGKPARRLEADLSGNGLREQVLLFDRTLLLLGPGVRGGRGYLSVGLPVEGVSDVLSVEARDVSGDRAAELWVTLRQSLSSPGAAPAVEREVLFIYELKGDAVQRVIGLEVALRQDARVLRNRVRVKGKGKRRRLVVEAGRARGWDAASYPFEARGQSDVRQLLLPWRKARERFRYSGGRLLVE